MLAFGWRPSKRDFRDFLPDNPDVLQKLNGKLKLTPPVTKADLRQWCSPIVDQGDLGSCTANAASGIYEYFENRTTGKYTRVSRIFIYKTTRSLAHDNGDTGAELRTTMRSMMRFGAPEEEYWPYDIKKFDLEPPAFVYALAQSFQALTYYRLDPAHTPAATVLTNIKQQINSGFPVMFGFTCYTSLQDADNGYIPYPKPNERVIGGHAIIIVGYDDAAQCPNAPPGAFLIRNSWGTSWGVKGYGYLPYQYVTTGLASDFWCMTKAEWTDSGVFA